MTSSTTTTTVELLTLPQAVKTINPQVSQVVSDEDRSSLSSKSGHGSPRGTLPSPNGVKIQPELLRWNADRTTVCRVLSTFYSFTILGANDAAYGALIPYLETYYNVNYTVISLVFLSPVLGYFISALTNNLIHDRFGQRGMSIGVGVAHIIAYLAICLHPPYPVLVVVFAIAGYGNGLSDAGFNAYIGDMANANEVLGFLHGLYGLGAALSPLTATALITKARWHWYSFYYIMLGAAVIELVVLTSAFWTANAAAYHASHATDQDEQDTISSTLPWNRRIINPNSTTVAAIKSRATILTAFFLLFYVGAEVSIGGWIVTFMLKVRHGSPFKSGMVSTGFWVGITLGRFILGFVTGRLFPSEKHAVGVYLVICLALQLLFWLIPSFTVSAVMVGFLGFFLAPLFPAGIVALTKLLPKKVHVAAVGFAASVGASGATILPFAVGAIANSKGVQVLQPIVLALIVVIFVIWMLIPRLPKQRMA